MDLFSRLHFLAQQDDDRGWARFIFGALVVLFWIFSAAASAIGKNQEKKRRERARRTIEPAPPAPQGPARPQRPPAYRTQTPPRPVRVPPAAPPRQRVPERQPQRPPQRVPQRSAAKKRPTTSPFAAAAGISSAAPTADTTKPIEATQISASDAPASRPPPPSANAAAIATWLNPRTLRHHFIVTEILQPPVGMREPRE